MTIKNIVLGSASFLSLRSDTAADTGGASDMAVQSRKDMVLGISQQLGANEDFNAHMSEAVKAKGTLQYAVVQTIMDLDMIFGEEELKEWPIVGSEGGNNPDKYKVRRKVAGVWKDVATDFYMEVTANTPQGIIYSNKLDAIKQVNNEAPTDDKEVAGMKARQERDALAEDMKEALSVHHSNVRQAMKFYQQKWAMSSMAHVAWNFLQEICRNPDGSVMYVTDEEGKQVLRDGKPIVATLPRKTRKPIKLFNPHETSEFKLLSIGQFVNLDLDTAKLNGGTYDDVIATRQRDTEEDEGHAEGQNVVVNSLPTFETAAAGMALYLGNADTAGLLKKRLEAAAKAGKWDDVSGLLESMRELAIELAGIMPTVEKLWNKYLETPEGKKANNEQAAA